MGSNIMLFHTFDPDNGKQKQKVTDCQGARPPGCSQGFRGSVALLGSRGVRGDGRSPGARTQYRLVWDVRQDEGVSL
jgi:hypothetical protein